MAVLTLNFSGIKATTLHRFACAHGVKEYKDNFPLQPAMRSLSAAFTPISTAGAGHAARHGRLRRP